MDLFDDLPAPATAETKSALYDDIPEDKSTNGKAEHPQQNDCKTPLPENKPVKRKLEEDVDQKASKLKSNVKYKLTSYFTERQGEREDMQDAHVLIEDFTQQFTDLHPSIYRLSFFAVYDGHGGARASRFASQNLHKILQDKFPKEEVSKVEKEVKKVLIETFKKTDEDFLKEATKSKPAWKDGTTATVILVINETAFIASLGDSQAVLCRRMEDNSCVPITLTTEHSPSAYEERIRIQKAGGHVKDGRVMGVLEVSRSIGDGQFKKHGVSCIPDVKKLQLTDHDRYIVLACDGLWKRFTPKECIQFTSQILEDNTISGTDNQTAEEARFQTASMKLANEAVLRLSADNVTVVLISISQSS